MQGNTVVRRLLRGPADWLLSLAATFLVWGVALPHDDPLYRGLSLRDAITRLEREEGLTIIYSSELVTHAMEVLDEPKAVEPTALLAEILESHGLAVAPGPRSSWLIVPRRTSAAPVERPREGGSPPQPVAPFEPVAPPLESVIVATSRYVLARDPAPSSQQVTRGQLESFPTLGEDAMRAAHGLPGLTSSGLSAPVNVRGGETNEALLYLDGVRLYSPFHLKDFESLFSSIDPRMLERIEFRTGGFPAQFGDRMSAVIDMRSLEPVEHRLHEVGVSMLTSSVLSSGRFAADKGSWVTSLRRGNLDLLAQALGSDIGKPRYVDLLTKVSYSPSSAFTISGNALLLSDEISLRDRDLAGARAEYDDTYLWARMEHDPGNAFAGRYLVAQTRLVALRDGSIEDPLKSTGLLAERLRFDVSTLKADWSYELSEQHLLLWGFELKRGQAEYRLDSMAFFPQPINMGGFDQPDSNVSADLDLDGKQRAAYVSYRARPRGNVTAEVGLRWDRQTYLQDEQLSPRVSLLIDVGERTSLRASWGRFYQAQGLEELQISDGVTELFPAQESEHTVLSLEYSVGRKTTLRIEGYRKKLARLRPRYENLFQRVSLLPELLPDRVRIEPLRGRARGLELAIDGEVGPWLWWINLTRSSAKDVLSTGTAPRSWEEPWSAKGGATWTDGRWSISLAATARSGWPSTRLRLVDGELAAADYNAARFGRYQALDLRASRRFALGRSELTVFGEVTNALNRMNDCCLDYALVTDPVTQTPQVATTTKHWLSAVPSFGVLWRF